MSSVSVVHVEEGKPCLRESVVVLLDAGFLVVLNVFLNRGTAWYLDGMISVSTNPLPLTHTSLIRREFRPLPHCRQVRSYTLPNLLDLGLWGWSATSSCYTSPELLAGWVDKVEDFDILQASDTYSYALIMWEMLSMCPVGQGKKMQLLCMLWTGLVAITWTCSEQQARTQVFSEGGYMVMWRTT